MASSSSSTQRPRRIRLGGAGGGNSNLCATVTGAVLFLSLFFVLQGWLTGSWRAALKGVIGFAWIMIAWYVTCSASLDAHIMNHHRDDSVVATTRGTVTKRCHAESSLFPCGSSGTRRRQWIRYIYTVDNVQYTNIKDAWFRYTDFDTSNNEAPPEVGDVVDVYYLVHEPHVSLPKCSGPTLNHCFHRVVPSAGSVNGTIATWNHVIFLVVLTACDICGMVAFGKVTDNGLWHVFGGHAVGVPTACALYYFAWMKPRERAQQFSPVLTTTTVDDNNDTKTEESTIDGGGPVFSPV